MLHLTLLILSWIFSLINSSSQVHSYRIGDPVPVSINTIGPYRNPNEKYPFYSKVPFCKPKLHHGLDKAGSVFMGDRPRNSDYVLPFKENIHEPKVVCEMELDQNSIKKYRDILDENYMFEYFIDHELLVTGFLGKSEPIEEDYGDHKHIKMNYYLFTHWNFHCEYNGKYVISCRITTDLSKKVDLNFGDNIAVTFTYSVEWLEIDVPINDRLMYHVRRLIRSQPLDVHWLSILNSFILVILVTAFIALVLVRILRQDCAKFNETRDELEEMDDPGWKQLKNDIFRMPQNIMLFASVVGTGCQLFVLTAFLLTASLIGLFYPGQRGNIIISIIFFYCITAGINGHISGTLYVQLGGKKWASNALLTSCLFPIPFFFISGFCNSVAWYYGSSIALPWYYIAYVIILYVIVTFPLTIYAARRVKDIEAKLSIPYKITSNKVARQIPQLPWYKNKYFQIFLSGILPFTSIYIELHFLFTSIFGHQVYTLFGILTLAFMMLIIVTCAVTIALTYFQLQNEDWRWWWTSFLTAGSAGLYIFMYSIFYYRYRSYMSGVLQATFFFTTMLSISYAFFLMLGSIGWYATFMFIKKIYGAIKSD